MTINRQLGAALVILGLCAGQASAQTCPTTNSTPAFTAGGSVFGRIGAQWNAYFGAKVDANNGTLCNPTIIGGIPGVMYPDASNATLPDARINLGLVKEGVGISVLDRGADPTGVADVSAIVATIANEGTNKITFPAGTYRFASEVSLPAGKVTIECEEGKTTLIAGAVHANNWGFFGSTQATNETTIRGCKFDGNMLNIGNSQCLIQLFRNSNHVIERNVFTNNRGVAVCMTRTNNSTIRNNRFYNVGKWYANGGSPTTVGQIISFNDAPTQTTYGVGNSVYGNIVTDIEGDFTSAQLQDGFRFEDNTVIGNGATGAVSTDGAGTAGVYLFFGSKNAVIAGNYISGMTGNPIDVHCSHNFAVTGNTTTLSGGAGIALSGSPAGDTATCNAAGTADSVSGFTVSGNTTNNNFQRKGLSPATAPDGGIWLGCAPSTAVCNITDFVISGNVATDDQVAKTQRYGVSKTANSVVARYTLGLDNQLDGNDTANTLNIATAPDAPNNILGNTTAHTYFAKAYNKNDASACLWTAVSDNSECILNAITAARANVTTGADFFVNGGADVVLPEGELGIASTILQILSPAVTLRGAGAPGAYGYCKTSLKWIGSAGGVMVQMGDDSTDQTIGGGLRGMCLKGGTVGASTGAGTAVKMRSASLGVYEDVYVFNVQTNAWDLDVSAADAFGLSRNRFTRTDVTLDQVGSINANGWTVGPGTTTMDVWGNEWNGAIAQYQNGIGWNIGNSDTNFFRHIWGQPILGGTGRSLLCKGAASGPVNLTECRENYFEGYFGNATAGTGPLFDTATNPSFDNYIKVYGMGSGAPLPVFGAGATLTYDSDRGDHFSNATNSSANWVQGGMSYKAAGTNGAVLDINTANSANFATAAKFGPTLPVYMMYNNPNIGFNSYWKGGGNFAYGLGSSGHYAGLESYSATTGTFAWGSTSATGNAGDTATITNQMTLSRAGAFTLPGLASGSGATTGTLCWTTATGNITVNTTVACLASDERLKTAIAPLQDPLVQVMKLKPISYRWNEEEAKKTDSKEHAGLGAFATAYVDERLIDRDAEGNPRSWRMDAVVALLTGAIQEQQRQIDRQGLYILLLGLWCALLSGAVVLLRVKNSPSASLRR